MENIFLDLDTFALFDNNVIIRILNIIVKQPDCLHRQTQIIFPPLNALKTTDVASY